MLVYLGIFFSSSLFSFCYSKARDKSAQVVFLICCFMSLFLPAALRYGIGVDYFSYVQIFKEVYSGHPRAVEPSIILICKIIQFFKLPYTTLFAVYAFLTYFVLFKAIPKNKFWLCIPVYVMILYLSSLNMIREVLGGGIMILAYRFFFEKRYRKFLITSLLGIFFHKAMTIPFILIFGTYFVPDIKKNTRIVLFLIVTFALTVLTSKIIFMIMNSILPHTGFANYAVNKYANAPAQRGSGMGYILKVLCLLGFMCLINKKNLSKNEYRSTFLICVYNVFAQNLMQVMYIFGRLVSSFSFSYIYLFLFASKSSSKYRKLLLKLLLIAYFALFVRDVSVSKIRHEKVGQFSGKNINPYLTVWNYYNNEIIFRKSQKYGDFHY